MVFSQLNVKKLLPIALILQLLSFSCVQNARCEGQDKSEECNENCDIDCARAIALHLFSDLLGLQTLLGDTKGELISLNSAITLLGEEKDLDETLTVSLGEIYGYRWLIHEKRGNQSRADSDFKKSFEIMKKKLGKDLKPEDLRYYLETMTKMNTKMLRKQYKDNIKEKVTSEE